MTQGFRVHILTPRARPGEVGLDDLYDGIIATPPERGQARHMMDDELHLIHRSWYKALRMMQRMGCIEWSVSLEVEDLPADRRTVSRPRASNGFSER